MWERRRIYNELEEDCKKEKRKEEWTLMRSSINRVRNMKRKMKYENEKIIMEKIKIANKEDTKGMWRMLKDLLPKGEKKLKKEIDSAINEEGEEIWDEEGIRETWRKAFEKLGKEEAKEGEFDEDHKKKIERKVREWETKERKGRGIKELIKKIDKKEIRKAIKRMKKGKAAGEDGIFNECIKYGGDEMMEWLRKLLNKCMEEEKVPEEWFRGVIFPIHKAGDKRDPNNYRGISLLAVVSKLYEDILNNRISSWMEKKGLIVEEQGAFRKERGCRD